MRKVKCLLSVLLAAALVFGQLAVCPAAEEVPVNTALQTAMQQTLLDPVQLYYYSDAAILRVASALGWTSVDADTFIANAIANGYSYVGGGSASAKRHAIAEIEHLMSYDETDSLTLNAVNTDAGYPVPLYRNNSKANTGITTVPVQVNGAPISPDDRTLSLHSGDRVTFAVALDTDFYLSDATMPIVYDATAFAPVGTDGAVWSEAQLKSADTEDLLDISAFESRPSLSNNYELELYSAASQQKLYPASLRTASYMEQYKMLVVRLTTRFLSSSKVLRFDAADGSLFTFTLQAKSDMTYDGQTGAVVGCDADWYANESESTRLFRVTRAAGYLVDGVTPASCFDANFNLIRRRGTAASACRPADNFAAYHVTLTLTTTFGTDLPVVALSGGKAYQGGTVTVTASVRNNSGLASAALRLSYDPQALSLADVQNGDVFADDAFLPGGDLTALPFGVGWINASGSDTAQDGVLVTFTFDVLATAPVGDTTVSVTYDAQSTYNAQMQPVGLAVQNAVYAIVARMAGDVNGDASVDLQDAVTLIRCFVGGWDVSILSANADVNRDGILNLRDVVLILRFITGGWGVVLR